MQWLRSRRTLTAGLGLFALLLQFALSFGHIHPEAFGRANSGIASALAASAVDKNVVADTQQQIPIPRSDDDCLICLTMHMAGAGMLPTPPAVFTAFDFSDTLPSAVIEQFQFGAPRHVLFQTRAPPTV